MTHGTPSSFLAQFIVFAGMCIGLSSTPHLAAAQDLPRVPVLPLHLAQEAARAALHKCQQDGYAVSVAIVDQGGNLQVLLRGDGAGPHTTDSSTRKAYTAMSLRRATMHLADLIAQHPALQALREMNERILILGGGLPIRLEGNVVGGIGVGGAPGAHLDEACARAGLAKIGATE
ncbi:MAG: heme-binding protein [Nitrospirae bacterium]|nr:MAG: heme-binding protein [Nitrospirota bacterium]